MCLQLALCSISGLTRAWCTRPRVLVTQDFGRITLDDDRGQARALCVGQAALAGVVNGTHPLTCLRPPLAQAVPSDASPARPDDVDTRQEADKGGPAPQDPPREASKGDQRMAMMPSASSLADEGVLPSPVSTSLGTPFTMADASYWIPVRSRDSQAAKRCPRA